MFLALYPRDAERWCKLRDLLESGSGRPASAATVAIYLLDRYDDLRRVDEAIEAEKAINRRKKKPKKTEEQQFQDQQEKQLYDKT